MFHRLSRLLIRLAPVLLAIQVLFSWNCAGKKGSADEVGSGPGAPSALIFDRSIKGEILGHRLKEPTRLTIDRRGTLFVVDAGNNRVIWFNADLEPLRVLDGAASAGGSFDEPHSVTVDSDLNLWVSDSGGRRLVQYGEHLEYIDEVDLLDDENPLAFGHPGAIAVSKFGEIYAVDTDNDRIAVMNPFGEIDRYVGDFGHSGGRLEAPEGMLVDRHDHVYVCDPGNSRVMLYDDRDGVVRELRHELMIDPVAVAIDRRGQVWVLDRSTAIVFCFSEKGEFSGYVGPMISGVSDSPRQPLGLGFTAADRLVIADTGNDRLLVCRILYSDSH